MEMNSVRRKTLSHPYPQQRVLLVCVPTGTQRLASTSKGALARQPLWEGFGQKRVRQQLSPRGALSQRGPSESKVPTFSGEVEKQVHVV